MNRFEQWIEASMPMYYFNGIHLPYSIDVLQDRQYVVLYPNWTEYGMNRLWSHTDKGWRSEYDQCQPEQLIERYTVIGLEPPEPFINIELDENREPRYAFVSEAQEMFQQQQQVVEARIAAANIIYEKVKFDGE